MLGVIGEGGGGGGGGWVNKTLKGSAIRPQLATTSLMTVVQWFGIDLHINKKLKINLL